MLGTSSPVRYIFVVDDITRLNENTRILKIVHC